MMVFVYILFAMALGLNAMLSMRNSAQYSSIRLTRGLLYSSLIALVSVLLMLAGVWVASLFSYQIGDFDGNVFDSVLILLAAKFAINTLSKQQREASYNIADTRTMILLSIALGLDALIGGIGFGFADDISTAWLKASLPLFLFVSLFAYLGIMLGRRQIEVKQRRWRLVAILFLVALVFMN